MTMTGWAEAVNMVDSRMPKSKVCIIIKEKCLSSSQKVLGSYQVDHVKAWRYVVEANQLLLQEMQKKRITNYCELESFYEEVRYHRIWAWNRINFKKTRR